MAKVQNFSEKLESSFVRLGHEVGERAKTVEARPEKEVVRESVKAMAEIPPEAVPAAATASASDNDLPFLPAYLSDSSSPAEVKQAVEGLINLTFKTDIETAVRAAKRYPPFVEDAFHDALVDRLLPELKKRGYLK